jgi:hypothetical protein
MSAAEVYLNARARLLNARGFHFVHYFVSATSPVQYSLEGYAIPLYGAKFVFNVSSESSSDWVIIVDEKNSTNQQQFKPRTKFFIYRKLPNEGWQQAPENIIVYGGQEIVTLEVLGNPHRASRDISFRYDEVVCGIECTCYKWYLDVGGYYTLWVSKETSDIVQLAQVHAWGSTRTVFSKIDEAVTIEVPTPSSFI